MSAGKIMRELRGNISLAKKAAAIGIKKSSLAMYERDERVPRDEVKVQIADHYGRSVQDIFFSQGEHK